MAPIPLVWKTRYVKMSGMTPSPDQPIHWDRQRANLNLTLVLGLVVAVVALFSMNFLLFVAGIGAAGYSWLTTAKQYWIYHDALIIVYGRPRMKVIPFAQVSRIELLSLPTGDRLRVQLVTGRPVLLAARDTETFRERLDTTLQEFRSAHPEEERGDGPYQARPPS